MIELQESTGCMLSGNWSSSFLIPKKMPLVCKGLVIRINLHEPHCNYCLVKEKMVLKSLSVKFCVSPTFCYFLIHSVFCRPRSSDMCLTWGSPPGGIPTSVALRKGQNSRVATTNSHFCCICATHNPVQCLILASFLLPG
jgi:hypothetical protein